MNFRYGNGVENSS